MKKFALTLALAFPVFASAANSDITNARQDTHTSGDLRVCVLVNGGIEWKCSKNFPGTSTLGTKITNLVVASKTSGGTYKLPFDNGLNLNSFTIEELDAAITKAAGAAAPATADAKVKVEVAPADANQADTRTVTTDKVCLVDSSSIINGNIHYTNLRLPGSTTFTAKVDLPYSGDSESKWTYQKVGNYRLDSTKQIVLTAEAPKGKFEGSYLPETMTVEIKPDAGGPAVTSYTCKMKYNEGSSESIDAPVTGVN